jgi:endonuclease/exonuclease/phosphatase family metal-dependent hydrolase
MSKSQRTHIRLVTVNAFEAQRKPFYRHLSAKLQKGNFPDVVCMQEAPRPSSIKRSSLGKHYAVVCEAVPDDEPDCSERLVILLSKKSKWTYSSSAVIPTVKCDTERVSQLATFTYRKKVVRIANVHLCGGKYDDGVYADTSSRKMRSIKSEAVNSLKRADIVLGDFNSLFDPFSNESYLEYVYDLGWDKSQIKAWNQAPFDRLSKLGFTRVEWDTPTTFYGNTPDSIWYRPELRLSSVSLIDMGASRKTASDHDGLLVSFIV